MRAIQWALLPMAVVKLAAVEVCCTCPINYEESKKFKDNEKKKQNLHTDSSSVNDESVDAFEEKNRHDQLSSKGKKVKDLDTIGTDNSTVNGNEDAKEQPLQQDLPAIFKYEKEISGHDGGEPAYTYTVYEKKGNVHRCREERVFKCNGFELPFSEDLCKNPPALNTKLQEAVKTDPECSPGPRLQFDFLQAATFKTEKPWSTFFSSIDDRAIKHIGEAYSKFNEDMRFYVNLRLACSAEDSTTCGGVFEELEKELEKKPIADGEKWATGGMKPLDVSRYFTGTMFIREVRPSQSKTFHDNCLGPLKNKKESETSENILKYLRGKRECHVGLLLQVFVCPKMANAVVGKLLKECGKGTEGDPLKIEKLKDAIHFAEQTGQTDGSNSELDSARKLLKDYDDSYKNLQIAITKLRKREFGKDFREMEELIKKAESMVVIVADKDSLKQRLASATSELDTEKKRLPYRIELKAVVQEADVKALDDAIKQAEKVLGKDDSVLHKARAKMEELKKAKDDRHERLSSHGKDTRKQMSDFEAVLEARKSLQDAVAADDRDVKKVEEAIASAISAGLAKDDTDLKEAEGILSDLKKMDKPLNNTAAGALQGAQEELRQDRRNKLSTDGSEVKLGKLRTDHLPVNGNEVSENTVVNSDDAKDQPKTIVESSPETNALAKTEEVTKSDTNDKKEVAKDEHKHKPSCVDKIKAFFSGPKKDSPPKKRSKRSPMHRVIKRALMKIRRKLRTMG